MKRGKIEIGQKNQVKDNRDSSRGKRFYYHQRPMPRTKARGIGSNFLQANTKVASRLERKVLSRLVGIGIPTTISALDVVRTTSRKLGTLHFRLKLVSTDRRRAHRERIEVIRRRIHGTSRVAKLVNWIHGPYADRRTDADQ